MKLIQHSLYSDWLLNTQSRVPQADLLILEINEKATLNINMLYSCSYKPEYMTDMRAGYNLQGSATHPDSERHLKVLSSPDVHTSVVCTQLDKILITY